MPTRRDLLRAAAAAGVLLPMNGLSRLAFADPATGGTDGDILVVLFLRGGCDALHLIGPANDPVYAECRVPDLRVLDSGDKAGLQLANGIDPKVDFRLHPEAAPLAELYRQGNLAIAHAVGLTDETRSHFVAQDLMERGYLDNATPPGGTGAAPSGWLARYLRTLGPLQGIVPAVSATNGVDKALEGDAGALAVPNLKAGFGLPGGDEARAALTAMYGPAAGTGMAAMRGRAAVAAITGLEARLPRTADGRNVAPYEPEHGAAYDENVDGGAGLLAVARLIKLQVGLRVACVDVGGWDTHENQPPRFAANVRNLSRNIAAFWNDLSQHHGRVTLVAMSEFGRRLRSNKSNGTDHGHGGAMLVLGGRIDGGRMIGSWPGLSTEALDRGVDLAVATDYRQVLRELVQPAIGTKPAAQLFPGLAAGSSLGLLRQA